MNTNRYMPMPMLVRREFMYPCGPIPIMQIKELAPDNSRWSEYRLCVLSHDKIKAAVDRVCLNESL